MTDLDRLHDPQFLDVARQRFASTFGMWVFLATEVLFFGGLFLGYAVYRYGHSAAFAAAGRETDVYLGTLNTLILLTSSLFVAIAVEAVSDRGPRLCRGALGLAIAFGVAFLLVKGYEYHSDLSKGLVPGAGSTLPPGPERVFFAFYWVMTGIHALHVTIGVGVLCFMFLKLLRSPEAMRHGPDLEVAGLYWHFVDGVWIFLYPLLYLMGRTG